MPPRATPTSAHSFQLHALRGPFNAAFFKLLGPTIERAMREQKLRVFAGLPTEVVELGSGVGATIRYMPWHSTLIAIEPNVYMHDRLRKAAHGTGVRLDIRERMAEDTGLPTASADVVI